MEKIKDYGWQRGEDSERKFFLALEELQKDGAFKNFGQSFRFSQEDLEKKDFCIISNEGQIIWFQVKISFNANDKEKCLRKGIQYVAIENKDLGEIKEEILDILREAKKTKNKTEKKNRSSNFITALSGFLFDPVRSPGRKKFFRKFFASPLSKSVVIIFIFLY